MKTGTRMQLAATVDMIKNSLTELAFDEKIEMIGHLETSLARYSLDLQLRDVCQKLNQPIKVNISGFDSEWIIIAHHDANGPKETFSYLCGCEYDLEGEELRPAAEIMGCDTDIICERLAHLSQVIEATIKLHGKGKFPIRLEPTT